jgi:hypothetical protein
MIERENNGLPPDLREATRVLREMPPLNDLWRQRLLREIEASAPPRAGAPGRRWVLKPSTAIAAAIACLVVGAAASTAVQRAFFPIAVAGPQAPGAVNRVRFTLAAPNASHVSLVGDFNGWNAAALPLRRLSNGTWEVEVPLAPGRYAYSFIVDGALAPDPSAPQAPVDDFGGTNSVVMVKGS